MQKTAIIIGARRSRQGLGEFITEKLAKSGIIIKAIVGTNQKSLDEASKNLKKYNISNINTYTDTKEALLKETPDITVIASPYKTHKELLFLAAEYNSHCLCEKPLIWSGNQNQDLEDIKNITELYSEKKLLLESVTQWPMTIPFFYKLHPDIKGQYIDQFSMTMGPVTTGTEMIIDSCSHPISMLQSLSGAGEIRNISFNETHDKKSLEINFDYQTKFFKIIKTSVKLIQTPERPRPAAYSINKCSVNRTIDIKDYTQYFHNEEIKLSIDDPLELLVNNFTAKIHNGTQIDSGTVTDSVKHLITIVSEYERFKENNIR